VAVSISAEFQYMCCNSVVKVLHSVSVQDRQTDRQAMSWGSAAHHRNEHAIGLVLFGTRNRKLDPIWRRQAPILVIVVLPVAVEHMTL
jgi:hypothetical protein